MGKRTEVPSEDGSATEDAESAEETDDTETDDAGDAQGQKDDAKPEQDDDKEDEKSAADESGKDEAGDESENRNESKESPDDVWLYAPQRWIDRLLLELNPFTPKSDQLQNSPAASPEILSSHSMKNLAFHLLLRWKMIILPILSLPHLYISL